MIEDDAILEDPADAGLIAVLTLATVQGLAEFLPISSSGHLAIGRALLDMREAGLPFDIALHVGTLGAVVCAYRRDVGRLIRDVFTGKWALFLWLVVASIPAAAIGFGFKSMFDDLAEHPKAAGAGLLVTAVLLVIGERARKGERAEGSTDPARADEDAPLPGYGTALAMGVAQSLALFPGVSRSGSTIVAGLLRKLPTGQAARLSFLMSLIAVGGAALVGLPDAVESGFEGVNPMHVAIGAVVAGVVGWLALRTLLLVLRRGALFGFALYCAVLGVVALAVG